VSAGRLLGVDYGEARIGLAVSDPERRIASPLATHEHQGPDRDAEFFRALVRHENVSALVVGLPVHADGREGVKATQARAFGAWLAGVTGLPVVYADERYTTVQAEQALWDAGLTHRRRRQRRDRVAAQMLLQAYLDAGCPDEPEVGPLEG
jgi:putative Holliday junction resolvase